MTDIYHLPGFYDPFSAISHLLGAGLFIVLGFLLLRRGRGSEARMAFLGIYAGMCVILMSMSGVFHMMVKGGPASRVMMRLDHSAIFAMIAGTCTPVYGLLFRGWWRWAPLLLIWAAAGAGIVLKAAFFRYVDESLGLTLYLAMGWIGALSGIMLWRRYGLRFILPLLLGGIAYTIGAASDFTRWPIILRGVIQSHEVFHVAVLVGALLHYAFIWRFAGGLESICAGQWSHR